uniref:phosphoinositide 5-phosphatase n=1 Tax=Xenopsylla cheopis TaxID=163159 RepID=A0A6M2DJ32_XENCH
MNVSHTIKLIVQEKFTAGERVLNILETLSESSPYQILSLVTYKGTTGCFSYLSTKTPPTSFSDLTLQTALPIDKLLECKIDDQPDGTVILNIVSKYQITAHVKSNTDTGQFVSEIYKAQEGNRGSFEWLKHYSENPESPDLAVFRHQIVKGADFIARDMAAKYHMQMKEKEYTYKQPYRIFVGTWNVNGQPPPSVSLAPWLASDVEPPDVYVIGFQELDLSKEAFLFNDTPREEEWSAAVMRSLHPGAVYVRLKVVRLVGIMLVLAVQEKHKQYVLIDELFTDTVGTGIMGKMGNKGGVGLHVELHKTTLCFVNSHLAAHLEEYERRNQDYRDICSRMRFNQNVTLDQHDQVYWLGDLNYRITDLEPDYVKTLLETEDYSKLLEADQLRVQHSSKNVFNGYEEGDITFKPTYKYDPGTDQWDSSEKNRAPAWCDRILWRGNDIKQIAYRSHPQLKCSDHKPVSALFESQMIVVDEVKYRKTHEDVMKQLDKLENEFLPQATVDRTEIDFGDLYFMEPSCQELTIANVGQVNVRFEFIKKLDDTSFCKDWLHVDPYTYTIKPGDKCDVRLTVMVDKRSACRLNCGQDKLYDILVLHLQKGKDIFITIAGNYQRSCFGSSIEALVQITVPIREISPSNLIELESASSNKGCYFIPKEIWFLVDHLYRYGLRQPRLFEERCLPSELIAIRQWLDGGSLQPLPGSVYSVAEALLLLLDSSDEPVIPYGMHGAALNCSHSYSQSLQLIMRLPDLRKNVFLYMCAFLQELLQYTKDNELDSKTLATLFGTIFLRDTPKSGSTLQPKSDRQKSNFVHHFLINDQSELINLPH